MRGLLLSSVLAGLAILPAAAAWAEVSIGTMISRAAIHARTQCQHPFMVQLNGPQARFTEVRYWEVPEDVATRPWTYMPRLDAPMVTEVQALGQAMRGLRQQVQETVTVAVDNDIEAIGAAVQNLEVGLDLLDCLQLTQDQLVLGLPEPQHATNLRDLLDCTQYLALRMIAAYYRKPDNPQRGVMTAHHHLPAACRS